MNIENSQMLQVGEVAVRGDERWVIEGIRGGWVFARNHGCRQWFPAGAFKPTNKKARVVARIKKPTTPAFVDDIAQLMSDAGTLENCWDMLVYADPSHSESRESMKDKNNGLQKMFVANQLRKLAKRGKIDIRDVRRTVLGGQS